jgi:hypothetical protein
MSDDRRERILVRILGILDEIKVDPEHVYRNRNGIELEDLPAYYLLDGREEVLVRSSSRGGPIVMGLQPQIYYVPLPTSNRKNDGVGEAMSARRILMMKAIMEDGQLQQLVGMDRNPGTCYIEYRGMETDMLAEGDAKGQFRLEFAFAYILDTNKL